MSIDADVTAAIATVTGEAAAPSTAKVDPDALFKLAGIDRNDGPAAKPAAAAAGKDGAAAGAAAEGGDELDPLDPKLYTLETLKTPEDFDKATKRILAELGKVNDLKRAAHRSHGAAEKREKKIETREQSVTLREQAAVAYDRAQQANMADLESGDVDRVLTGLHRLSKVGDPAGLWRNIMLKIASGGKFSVQEQAAAKADPEVQRRLEMVENVLKSQQDAGSQAQAAAENAAIEQFKTRNLEAAAKNTATPRVVVYATDPRTAETAREALAEIMVSTHRQTGRPIDISKACAILEESLAVHYELSQRADGKTNGEKETAGLEPDAGRAPSKVPPKPDGQLSTIPTQLGSAPAVAKRPLTEREQREATVQGLDSIGFFSRFGL